MTFESTCFNTITAKTVKRVRLCYPLEELPSPSNDSTPESSKEIRYNHTIAKKIPSNLTLNAC
ncbi:12279_t:CDS:2 [Ambispora leptoticha]|uniref:12279_t:CDS:1 n=1 Tax=Ambispora leptoticha TaxID=144679 RepID=A0A9N9F584_9GLOM|nr:12279_t:CDS:2 [Ambispora leptoticha]